MKTLKKIASLAIATVVVAQGAGIGSLGVLAAASGDVISSVAKTDYEISYKINLADHSDYSGRISFNDYYGAWSLDDFEYDSSYFESVTMDSYIKNDLYVVNTNSGVDKVHGYLSDESLFTFEKTDDGKFKIYNEGNSTSVQLVPPSEYQGTVITHLYGSNFDVVPALNVELTENGSFNIFSDPCKVFGTSNAVVYAAFLNSDEYSRIRNFTCIYDQMKPSDPSSYKKDMYIYEYSQDSSGNAVYTRVLSTDEIISGNKYVIASKDSDENIFTITTAKGGNTYELTGYFSTGYTAVDVVFNRDSGLKSGDVVTIRSKDGNTTYSFEIDNKVKTPSQSSAVFSDTEINMLPGETKEITVKGATFNSDTLVYPSELGVTCVNNENYDTSIGYKKNGSFLEGLASDALFTITEVDGGYTVESVSMPGAYLDITPNGYGPLFSDKAETFTIGHADGSDLFTFKQNSTGELLDYVSSYNFNVATNTASHCNYLSLYKKVTGKGSDEIPGYEKVTSITSGEQYLIVATSQYDNRAQLEACQLVLLYPTFDDYRDCTIANVKDSYFAGSCVISITADASLGEASAKVECGEQDLHITIFDIGESVTYEDTMFSYYMETDYTYQKITELNLVTGENPSNINISSYIDPKATDVKVFSSNSKYMTATLNGAAITLTTPLAPVAERDGRVVNVYLCIKYKLDGQTVTKNMPVTIYLLPNYLPYYMNTIVIPQIDNVDIYYSLTTQSYDHTELKNDDGTYLFEAKPGEAFDSSMLVGIYIKPHIGYAFEGQCSTSYKYTPFNDAVYWNKAYSTYGLKEAKEAGATGGVFISANNLRTYLKGNVVSLSDVTAVEIFTPEKVELPCDIPSLLPDETYQAGEKVPVRKIYYVDQSVNIPISDLVGDNDPRCIKAIYKINPDGTGVFNSIGDFPIDANDPTKIMARPQIGESTYIIIYDNGTDVPPTPFAVKFIGLKTRFSGMIVGMGSTLSVYFLASFADKESALADAAKKGYDQYSEEAVDYTSLGEIDKDSFICKMEMADKETVISEGSKFADGRYLYRYSNIFPYELDKYVFAYLYPNAQSTSRAAYVGDSICSYLNAVNSPLCDALKIYGAYAEKYAVEQGWIVKYLENSMVQAYITEDTVVADIPDSAYDNYKNNKTDNCQFTSAQLTLEEGMGVSLTFEYVIGADVDLSKCKLVVHSNYDDGLGYDNVSKDTAGNIYIPGTAFEEVKGKENTYQITIKNIPAAAWGSDYHMYLDIDGKDTGLTFSVNDYLYEASNSEVAENDSTLACLLKAMYEYGFQVYAYLPGKT